MYEFDVNKWDWRCTICDKVATEDHCQSQKHQKWVLYQRTEDRRIADSTVGHAPLASPLPAQLVLSPPWSKHFDIRHQTHYYHNSETLKSQWHNPMPEIQWRQDAETWGIQADALITQLHCGPDFAALSLSRTALPSCTAFSYPMQPPDFAMTMSFWGAKIFDAMKTTLNELVHQGGRLQDLHHFAAVPQDSWFKIMVYSDATKGQQATPKSSIDAGMWWPAIAVPVGNEFKAWCQDFALNRARKAWNTHPSRCHIYLTRQAPAVRPPVIDPILTSTVVIEEIDDNEDNEDWEVV